MTDSVTSQRVISGGGLNTLDNYLTLSTDNPGAATQLQNYETSLSGGYRRINGYVKYNQYAVGGNIFDDFPTSIITEGKVLFITTFYNSATNAYEIIAARKLKLVDHYGFFKLTVTGWVQYTTGFNLNMTHPSTFVVTRIRSEQFNFGDKNQIIFTDGVNFATVYDGTTWYQLKSTNTGGSGSSGGNQLLDAPKYVTFFKNTLFVSGDIDFPAIVAHSAPNDSLTWTAAAGGGQILPGFEVAQIKPFRDENYVFGNSKIRKIIVDGINFVVKDVTNNLGCIAPDSVIEVGGQLLFLSTDGIRPVAGTMRIDDIEIGLISEQIQETLISNINTYDMSHVHGVNIRTKTQFRYFMSGSGDDVTSAFGLIGSLRFYGADRPSFEFGTLRGIRSNVASSTIMNLEEIVLHGDFDGYIYQQERGHSFDTRSITAVYSSPYLDMGNTEIRKTIRELVIFAKSEGAVNINVGMKFDWGSNDAENPGNYSADFTGGAVYGASTSIYGTSVYAVGNRPLVFRLPVSGSGYSVQYSFSTTGDEASYTIHGFTQEFTPDARA